MDNLMDEIKNNSPDIKRPDQIDSLIIYGGPVYDGKGNVYNPGSVYIENGTIRLIDEEEEVFSKMDKALQNVEIVNSRGKLVTPGLINAHQHPHMGFSTGLTALGPTTTFGERLENFIWPYEKSLTKEALQLSTLLTILESIKFGVTTIFSNHSAPSSIASSHDIISGAFERAGLRGLLSYSITDQFGQDKFQEAVEETRSFVSEHRIDSLVKGIPGLHANMTVSEESLEEFTKHFDTGQGLHIHLGESVEDLEYCQDQGYKGCIDRLDQFNLISERSLLAHANHLSDADRKIIDEKQPALIHNPVSNANSKAGWFDLKLANNTVAGLGTDGMSSNLFSHLNKAYLLHNLVDNDNSDLEQKLVDMLFQNNAQLASSHFDLDVGTLNEGSRADLVMFDYKPHTLIHSNNINKHLIQGLQDGLADTVIVDGKVIYKDKAYLTIDKKIVKEEASEICQSIWENYLNQAGNSNSSPTA